MSPLDLFALIVPGIPLLVGCLLPVVLQASPKRAARLAWLGAAGSFVAVSLAAAGRLLWSQGGLQEGPLRVDALGLLMLATISLIGAVVARFALRYLDGDPAQRSFSIWLGYTLSAISVLPLASNLAVLFLAWVASSHGLHRLLTLYSERPGALLAARKKFVISRLGDFFLVSAFAWIYIEWGSLDIPTIFERARLDAAAGQDASIFAISLLIILGAITKSAQFPFHSWLPDTMQAPTPVSALMHAGVINAGGFLLVRMSPLLALAPGALTMLAFVGGFSAMLASLIMLTQNDVKRKLAFSTISQMGFMMFQVGLGAFAAAMLHIVGHSFYKAHAFLSAGSWVDPKGVAGREAHHAPSASWSRIAIASLSAAALAGVSVWALGVEPDAKPGGWVLVGVLAIAISQGTVIWSLISRRAPFHGRNIAFVVLAGGGLSVFYLGAVSLFDVVLGDAIARPLLAVADPRTAPGLAVIGMFAAAMIVQLRRPSHAAGPAWTRIYVLLRHGLHVDEFQNRWVRRLWRRIGSQTPSTG